MMFILQVALGIVLAVVILVVLKAFYDEPGLIVLFVIFPAIIIGLCFGGYLLIRDTELGAELPTIGGSIFALWAWNWVWNKAKRPPKPIVEPPRADDDKAS